MRRRNRMAYAAAACATAVVGSAVTSRGAVVINEIYAGGGSSSASAAYKTDYIELFNTSATDVPISGYTLAYGASAQPAGSFPTAVATIPANTTLTGLGYYLVRAGTAGTGGATDPTADLVGSGGASLSNTSGGLRLADAPGSVLDVVGWGTTNNFEVTPESSPASVAVSLQRFPNGSDLGNNQSDFIQDTPTPKAANTPEPACLGAIGCAGLLMLRRRRV
jgi:hypothetical protein